MYDIRQFNSALYALLILGLSCFALAAELPGVWVLSVGAVLLHFWLGKLKIFGPMPRLLANTITLAALGFVVLLLRDSTTTAIVVVGEFLVFLQIVKLFELRANRDYAQLLVLSLLLVVAATISTSSFIFFLLLIAYLCLSLYCCLLFHLKAETDHAKAALGIEDDVQSPPTLRQDQRYLASSMRRLTLLVAGGAVCSGVFVFLFFPRSSSAGLFSSQFRGGQTMTGFSEQVSFQNIAKITQNEDVVARVKVSKNDVPVRGTEPLLLRGLTLDVYTGAAPSVGAQWQWIRSRAFEIFEPESVTLGSTTRPVDGNDVYVQDITLYPTGTAVIFAIGGITSIQSKSGEPHFRYSRRDEVLQLLEPARGAINYSVVSRNTLTEAPPQSANDASDPSNRDGASRRFPDWQRLWRGRRGMDDPSTFQPLQSEINPKVQAYASRPEVCGVDDAGKTLASLRDHTARVTDIDLNIAANIQSHLRDTFSYTLDLTDATLVAGRDPLEAFLYDFKRGHCEYFAGAMTLMCQSLGMRARMAIGFRCDDYNTFGEYYNVKQSHAHAWVEVLGPDGIWHIYDPTSSRDAPAGANGVWHRMKNLVDYLNYTWANTVIAYDKTSRANLISNTQDSVATGAVDTADVLDRARNWLNRSNFVKISANVVTGLLMLLVAAIGWFLIEKWKLRRRARRIGLAKLPMDQQRRLARQLGFYDDLLLALEKQQIVRPAHLTPLEFSESITFVPNETYDAIRRITEIFYRVRFGRAELSPAQRRHLDTVVRRIDVALGHSFDATNRQHRT